MSQSKVNRNFGVKTNLRVMEKSGKRTRTYLKFVVSGLGGSVQSATLRLHVQRGGGDGGTVYQVANSWSENSINYNNAPLIGGVELGRPGSVVTGQYVDIDVTSAITGEGTYSFGIRGNSRQSVDYDSRESTFPPELIIQVDAGGGSNQPPVADAGADQVVTDMDKTGDETVTLDASGSFDTDGTIVSYTWSENGTTIATGETPTVTLGIGVHNIDLMVTDDAGQTATDQVVVTVVAAISFTMDVYPPAGGLTNPTAGTVITVPANQVVTITATPNPGYVFGYWTGVPAIEADQQTLSLTMATDAVVTANFIQLPPAPGEVTAASLGYSGAIQAYGPPSIFGFPTYVTDSRGISLIHGVNLNDPLTPEALANPNDPFFDPTLLSDPYAPLDVQAGNFFEESFYFAADALVPTAAGRALLTIAGGEAVFFTPDLSVQDGFQTLFNRLRFRVDLPNFSGETRTYVITHPYGVETFEVTSGGPNAINHTIDTAVEVGFNSILDGTWASIDPFLVWTGGEAPVGYIGDPNFEHPVTGSPYGTNFFRIEGPDIGGPGIDYVQTYMFTVSGKVLKGAVITPANEPPVAYAGPDQKVPDNDQSGSELVQLSGSGSFDVDGIITSYQWSQGGTVLSNSIDLTVNLPLGTHVFELTVTDDQGASHTDAVTVVVRTGNEPPVAVAGEDFAVTDQDNGGNETVTLDASQSSDSDGSIVAYTWSEGGVTLATSATPTLTLSVGTHVLDLTVRDNMGATGTDQITVYVNPKDVYTLFMEADPPGAGTTTPASGSVNFYSRGDKFTITATPASGWVFSEWVGGTRITDPTSASTLLEMRDNQKVIARFTKTFDLTMAVFPAGGGTTTPASGTTGTFLSGDVVTVTATPAPGYVFGYWTGVPPLDASASTTTVTMDADKTVTANFIQLPPAPGEVTAASLGYSGALQAYGPVNIFGFPSYVTDSNGLSLVHGVNINDPLTPEALANPNDPAFDPTLLPDPFAPLDVTTGNFFEESFYFSAAAQVATATGTADLAVAGGEAVFFTPDFSVQDGFQTLFNRLRIRVDLPEFSGETRTYVVTHPYGVETFQVTSGGRRAINHTVDSAVEVGFNSILDGSWAPIDPFLVWTGNQAPPGYVGDPNFDHTVTGSPYGTNFFRIEGPDIGGPGVNMVETDLFSISGKLLTAPANGAMTGGGAPPALEAGESSGVPQEYGLHQNYPNPFNPVTTIRYALPEEQRVRLAVYNMLGQQVAVIVDERQPAGYHQVQFDGRDLASGIYLYKLEAGSFVGVKKLILLK
ncbi:MAG: DNRLRE domain-containing protein [Calditrichaeota bacterium]|nr:MAG: DNRLRE domain-containing protein [Calditrichota bacterium]